MYLAARALIALAPLTAVRGTFGAGRRVASTGPSVFSDKDNCCLSAFTIDTSSWLSNTLALRMADPIEKMDDYDSSHRRSARLKERCVSKSAPVSSSAKSEKARPAVKKGRSIPRKRSMKDSMRGKSQRSLRRCAVKPKAVCGDKNTTNSTKIKNSKQHASSSVSAIRTKNGGGNTGQSMKLLLDLGQLVRGTVQKRPSSMIKSPYVADVKLSTNEMALAHAPALDVGGLCSPGATVFMRERPPGGKTSHSIDLVAADGPDGQEGSVLVGAHPSLGEKLAELALQRGLLEEALGIGAVGNGIALKKQVTYGDSRVDFELIDESARGLNEGKRLLIEVKNVVCADFSSDHAPVKSGPNHCVVIAESNVDADRPYDRTALFPWGRVGQTFEGEKVVSERAIKHIRNLVDMGHLEENLQPVILFVVNRSDCEAVRSCHEACPKFASELKAASENGVNVIAFRVRWDRNGKAFFDGVLPVQM
mmetsp:Transcript_57660/g.172034  ORF Transcript_57660/g.172034 Transcript_57660/m.172034 type:complete len:478 (-) Transcript_57660:454-1887(-)